MRFSQRTEYALRALVELGSHGPDNGLLPCREIADRQKIPERFCEQVVGDLRRAGLITSQRGAAGGVRLARDAKDVTVSDVVEAVEGPVVTQASLDPFD